MKIQKEIEKTSKGLITFSDFYLLLRRVLEIVWDYSIYCILRMIININSYIKHCLSTIDSSDSPNKCWSRTAWTYDDRRFGSLAQWQIPGPTSMRWAMCLSSHFLGMWWQGSWASEARDLWGRIFTDRLPNHPHWYWLSGSTGRYHLPQSADFCITWPCCRCVKCKPWYLGWSKSLSTF